MSKLELAIGRLIDALKDQKDKGHLNPRHIKSLEALVDEVRPVAVEKLAPLAKAELIRQLNLKVQYGERIKTLKYYGFLDRKGETRNGVVQPPTFKKAMSTFAPEELEIASHFQKPTLLLVPEISLIAKKKALDAHKKGKHKHDTYVDTIYSEIVSGSDRITGWRAFIVDGAQEMKVYEGDSLDLRFDKRIEARKATRKISEKGMDRHRYALLMMETIRNGNPVDQKSYTLLDDDPALSDSHIPTGDFLHGVNFNKVHPNSVDKRARLRSSVGGDIILS